jgi:hypothetical protein
VRTLITLTSAAVAALAGAYLAWRRNPRIGSGFVNRVIDPILLERGLSGAGRSEIGTLEHIGRNSGTRRLTPVHPVPTERGFRIIVPLGIASEWARNVVAAGHCRLQLHDVIHELDEPALVEPGAVPGLPALARQVSSWLGFRYLLLHSLASSAGSLTEATVPREEGVQLIEEPLREVVSSPS